MNFYGFNEQQLLVFFACLVRIGVLFLTLPFFSHANIPPTIKILFSFMLTLIFFPIVDNAAATQNAIHMFASIEGIFVLVVKEGLVGFIVGFVAKLLFESLAFAFSYMGSIMGFGFSAIYDHDSESQTAVIAKFIMSIVMLVFLATDGHLLFISAIADTFKVVPLGTIVFSKGLTAYIFDTALQIFLIAVQISAPMAVVIFLINIAFGIIAKAVPQINVLVVSFNVNIMIGLLVVFLTIPTLNLSIHDVVRESIARMHGVLKLIHG